MKNYSPYISHGFENVIGESITQTCEPMDLHVLLERAQMGLIDLSSLSKKTPVYDGEDADNLLDRDLSITDNTFGASREDALDEYHRQVSIVNQEREEIARKKQSPNAESEQSTEEAGRSEE